MKKILVIFSFAFILLSLSLVMSASTCTDTDGGINLDVKGSISGVTGDGKSYKNFDTCSINEDNVVLETYCINGFTGEVGRSSSTDPIANFFDCDSGEICKEGACVPKSGESCKDAGGVCRNACDNQEGEISIGIIDCDKIFRRDRLCCKPGKINDCIFGNEPFCVSDPTLVSQCNPDTGVTTTFQCTRGGVCDDGECVFGDKCEPYLKVIPNVPCLVSNFLDDFKIWFAVVLGLIGGVTGALLSNRIISKKNRRRKLLILGALILAGLITGLLAWYFFWWALLSLIVLIIILIIIIALK